MKFIVRKGDFLDAFIEALGENSDHGFPRSNEDKRKAVREALEENDKINRGWSNRQIAAFCKVSPDLVDRVKKATPPVESACSGKKDSGGGLSDDDSSSTETVFAAAFDEDSPGAEQPYPAMPAYDDSEDESPAERVPCHKEGVELPSQAIAAFNMLPDLRVFLRALDQAAKSRQNLPRKSFSRIYEFSTCEVDFNCNGEPARRGAAKTPVAGPPLKTKLAGPWRLPRQLRSV
jgi:hypothetical protein